MRRTAERKAKILVMTIVDETFETYNRHVCFASKVVKNFVDKILSRLGEKHRRCCWLLWHQWGSWRWDKEVPSGNGVFAAQQENRWLTYTRISIFITCIFSQHLINIMNFIFYFHLHYCSWRGWLWCRLWGYWLQTYASSTSTKPSWICQERWTKPPQHKW